MSHTLYNSITQENIEELVRTFYPKVLKNPTIAPFFIERLGEEIQSELWEEHLVLLSHFWQGVALGYEEYHGNPLEPHTQMPNLSPKAFQAWLSLFHETVDTLYSPQVGIYFKDKSNEIAQNFMRRLQL